MKQADVQRPVRAHDRTGTSGGPSGGGASRRRRRRTALTAYALIAPLFVFFLTFAAYPLAQGIWISLHDWDLLGGPRAFVALGNYARLVGDPMFWTTLGHTFYFLLLSGPLLIAAALGLALLVGRNDRVSRWARPVFYLPVVLSVSVASTIWLQVYAADGGMLNGLLAFLGLDPDGSVLRNPALAMPAIVVMTLWWTVGTNMLFFVAGLQDIPDEVYEAAQLDGAGWWRRLFSITLPGLRRTFAVVLVLQVVASLQVFGQVYVLTNGGPIGATRVLMQYVIETSFRDFNIGYGSAMGTVLFLVMMAVSVVQLRMFNRQAAVR